MIDQLIGVAVEAGAKHVAKKATSALNASRPPKVTHVKMAEVLPRRVALARAFTAEELLCAPYQDIYSARLSADGSPFGWVNCAELTFRLENPSSDAVMEIIGFHIDWEDLDISAPASFLDIDQGDRGNGEAWRFVCVQTNVRTVRQRYDVVDHAVRFLGERDYFELSTLQLAPAGHENVCLTLVSNDGARIVTSVEIIYETCIGAERVPVPLPCAIRIFPLGSVPESQRLRLSWQPCLPAAVIESDDSVIPADKRRCPWDDFK